MPALNFIKVSLPESSLKGWLSCKLQAKQTEAYQTIAFSHDAAQKISRSPWPRQSQPRVTCLPRGSAWCSISPAGRAGRSRRISRGSRRVPRCRVGIDPGQLSVDHLPLTHHQPPAGQSGRSRPDAYLMLGGVAAPSPREKSSSKYLKRLVSPPGYDPGTL